MTIFLYLDDVRNAPSSEWKVFRSVNDLWNEIVELAYPALDILNPCKDHIVISLDHDLGENQLTGYDFLNRLEKVLTLHEAPEFKQLDIEFMVHSANPVGADNMRRAIGAIKARYDSFST